MVSYKFNKGAGVVALVAVALDFVFHYFLTEPMESVGYFIVKLLVAYGVAWFMFAKGVDLKRLVVFSFIFALLFGVFYRLTELFSGSAYLSRVPEIHLGVFSITSATPLLAAAVWIFFHGSFFLVGW